MKQCAMDETIGEAAASAGLGFTSNRRAAFIPKLEITKTESAFQSTIAILGDTDPGQKFCSYIKTIIDKHAAELGNYGCIDLAAPTMAAFESEAAIIASIKALRLHRDGNGLATIKENAKNALMAFIRQHDAQKFASASEWTPQNGSGPMHLCVVTHADGCNRTCTIQQAAFIHSIIGGVRVTML